MKIYTRAFTLLLSFFIFLTINSVVFGAVVRKPVIPQKLAISKLSTTEITLKWNKVSYATGYKIYRRNPNSSKYVQVGKTSRPTFKNIKLKSGASYWYYVKSYNSYGTSKASKTIKATTKKVIPMPLKKLVIGFATNYYNGDVSSYHSLVENKSSINQMVTATYTANGVGNLTGTVPINQMEYAKKNNIKTIAMVSNNFDGKITQSILESTVYRKNLINNLLLSIQKNNYSGVNIDFEGIYSSDRDSYTAFIKELYNKLHPLGFMITISVPAKTIDSPTNSWNWAYDYVQLSKYADSIVIMAYDEHYPGGDPGPVASVSWVQAVAKYTTTVIPKNKISFGVASYGYDWSSSGTKAYGIDGINNLASKYKAQIMWDNISKCPYFKYTDEKEMAHEVWFENSTSLGYKLDIVNSFNLSGIAIWRLGLETPDFWTTIKAKFNQ